MKHLPPYIQQVILRIIWNLGTEDLFCIVSRDRGLHLISDLNNDSLISGISGNKWKKNNITYEISKYSETLPDEVVDEEISRAFQLWAAIIPMNITFVPPGQVWNIDYMNSMCIILRVIIKILLLGWYKYTFWEIWSRRCSLWRTWLSSSAHFLPHYFLWWDAKKFYSFWRPRKLDREFNRRCNFFNIHFFILLFAKLIPIIVCRSRFFSNSFTRNRPFFRLKTFECWRFCYVAGT